MSSGTTFQTGLRGARARSLTSSAMSGALEEPNTHLPSPICVIPSCCVQTDSHALKVVWKRTMLVHCCAQGHECVDVAGRLCRAIPDRRSGAPTVQRFLHSHDRGVSFFCFVHSELSPCLAPVLQQRICCYITCHWSIRNEPRAVLRSTFLHHSLLQGFLAFPLCLPGTAVWRGRCGRLYILSVLERAAGTSKAAMKVFLCVHEPAASNSSGDDW